MEYFIQVKEEPAEDETVPAAEADVNFHPSERFKMQLKKEDVTELAGNFTIMVKEERQLSVSHDNTNIDQSYVEESNRNERKRKSSSTLLEILKPNEKNQEMKKRPPTLTQLLNGPNLSAMHQSAHNPEDSFHNDDNDDVQIVQITSPPLLNKCNKPTLQKMLASPYSGKTPLLSSILKSTSENSKTNSVIDQVFTSVESITNTPEKKQPQTTSSTLSAMLGHTKPTSVRTHPANDSNILNNMSFATSILKKEPVKEDGSHLKNQQTQSVLNNLLNSKLQNSQILLPKSEMHQNSNIHDSKPHQNSNSSDSKPSLNHLSGLYQNMPQPVLQESSNPHPTELVNQNLQTSKKEKIFEGNKMESLPKEFQNEEMINMWTNVITKKVISEFSKDVNATVNSFVKKAILESLSASSSNNPLDISNAFRTGGEETSNSGQVSSLASNLLSTLAEKVGGTTLSKHSDSSAAKPSILKGIFTENVVNRDMGGQVVPNSELLGLKTSVPSTNVKEKHSTFLETLSTTLSSKLSGGRRLDSSETISCQSQKIPASHILPSHNTCNNSMQITGQSKKPVHLKSGSSSLQMILQPAAAGSGTASANSAQSIVQQVKSSNQNKDNNLTQLTLKSMDSSNQRIDSNSTQMTLKSAIPSNQKNSNNSIQMVLRQGKSANKNNDKNSPQMFIQPVNSSNQNADNSLTKMIPQPVQGPDGKFLIFSCNICGKRFQHHGTLSVHQRTHLLESGKSDFKCDICGKICTAQRYLDIHMKTHLKGQRPITGTKVSCSICEKEFTSEENLIIHKRLHLGEKLYQCEVCHTGFTRNSQLAIHMRIHSGEKPYICNICGKSFRQSNGLTLHQNVHMVDKKPYKCEICGTGFSRKIHYEKHMKKERGETHFKCKECGKGFPNKINLNNHIQGHQKEKPLTCKICGKGYVQTVHFRNHMKFHSGERGYDCPHCPERFEQRQFLTNHLIIAHKVKEESLTNRKTTDKDSSNDSDSDEMSSDGEESNDSTQEPPGYTDMIMHISQEFEESQNREFDHLNQDYPNELDENSFLSQDDVKVEPIEFSLSSDSLKSSFEHNTLLDFDPTIVKEEPGDCLEEDLSVEENSPSFKSSNINFYPSAVKEEPFTM